MLILLYLLVCSFSFGMINLTPLLNVRTPAGVLNGQDLLLIALFALSAPAYLRQRPLLTRSSPWFRRVEAAWLIFIVVIVIAAYRSPASTLTERFVNVRSIETCALFFPTIAVITTRRRLRIFLVAGVLFAIAGTYLTVAQSLHGLNNLFDSPYYDIGSWGGNKQVVGSVARVNLPISNWIAYVLLILAASIFLKFGWLRQLLGGLLFIPILINFARSLWLGMIAALIVEIILLMRYHSFDFRVVGRALAMPIMVVIGLFIAPSIGLGGILASLTYRINEGENFFLTGSGTFGARLDSTAYAIDLWHTAPWWGLGIPYFNATGVPLDVAYAIALVSVGICGLCAILYLFATCFMLGLSTLRQGVRNDLPEVMVIGLAVAAEVVLILVYQQWLDRYSIAILGFASALAVTGPSIFSLRAISPTAQAVEVRSGRLLSGLSSSGESTVGSL